MEKNTVYEWKGIRWQESKKGDSCEEALPLKPITETGKLRPGQED